MGNPVEIYYGSKLLFRFNPSPTNISLDIQKTGVSTMDLPTFIRPWAFDFTSQERRITINAMLINTDPLFDTYAVRNRGTGSILDQIEDLMFIASGNWARGNTAIRPDEPLGNAANGVTLLYLIVPYNNNLYSGHVLGNDYNQTGDNTDAGLDQLSVPSNSPDVHPTNLPMTTATGANKYNYRRDKIYYAYPTQLQINRDTASVNRVPITMSFIEIQDVIMI